MDLDVEYAVQRPKIDMHAHVWHFDDPEHIDISADHLVASAEMLGITELWCSSPYTGKGFPSLEVVRKQNDAVLRAMRRHPKRIRGMAYLCPGHFNAAIEELDRCMDEGFVGIKLYHQYRLSDPVQWPVLERSIEHKAPILMHAGFLRDPEHLAGQPLVSHGADFAEANRRYPEAILIHAHIGGGGDWERTIREMRDTGENLYVDCSGSNLDDGQVEFAIDELGTERVLFGTDGTMAGAVGKVLDAKISDEQRETIFWSNAERILTRCGKTPTKGREKEAV